MTARAWNPWCGVFRRSAHAADRAVGGPPSSTPIRATTFDHLRLWLRTRHIVTRIARRGIESSHRLGRHRWTVERTVAWPAGCRRLHRRYERKADHFLAFAGIAAALICYRRLVA